MNSRDKILVLSIIDVIDEIFDYVQRFECKNFLTFNDDRAVKRATTMCMISLSELIDNLTMEFKTQHSYINFRQFKALRNIAAHKYGSVNFEMIWEIITKNLPVFKKQFARILRENP